MDDYVTDVLMRDLVGHDKHPAAFLVFLHLYSLAARGHWQPVQSSLRDIADQTGLSKSAVQGAMTRLRNRGLVTSSAPRPTAAPSRRLHRHWAE